MCGKLTCFGKIPRLKANPTFILSDALWPEKAFWLVSLQLFNFQHHIT